MELINGNKIKEEMLLEIKKEVANLSFQPIFCDILVGDDRASVQYVNMKAKMAESVGIKFHNANFPISITTEELINEIKILNDTPNMCGIIVQLPIPEHLNKAVILNAINPKLDVDCLGEVASDLFYANKSNIYPPAASACMQILDSLNLDLHKGPEGKKIVVLGQGMLVGKPVSALLKFRGIEPQNINKETENKEGIIKNADIIISGIGQGKYIMGDMVKEGVVLIDAGTTESNGGIVGDVDLESVESVASYVSPVPGGVGPVTVATLLSNVLQVAKNLK